MMTQINIPENVMALGTLLSVKINKAILISSPFGTAKRGETQGVASILVQ